MVSLPLLVLLLVLPLASPLLLLPLPMGGRAAARLQVSGQGSRVGGEHFGREGCGPRQRRHAQAPKNRKAALAPATEAAASLERQCARQMLPRWKIDCVQYDTSCHLRCYGRVDLRADVDLLPQPLPAPARLFITDVGTTSLGTVDRRPKLQAAGDETPFSLTAAKNTCGDGVCYVRYEDYRRIGKTLVEYLAKQEQTYIEVTEVDLISWYMEGLYAEIQDEDVLPKQL